jgi:hypothetical protein
MHIDDIMTKTIIRYQQYSYDIMGCCVSVTASLHATAKAA